MRNLINSKFLTTVLCILFAYYANSQADFSIRKKRLTPENIDTVVAQIFVFETPDAILYFKQKDITSLLNKPNIKQLLGNYSTAFLQDTFSSNSHRIQVKDILYYYTSEQRDSIYKVEKVNEKQNQLNQEFYFIGAALILEGKFMVYDKQQKTIIKKGLIAKRKIGYLGQRTLEFYLPNKKSFYYIITALGE